VHALAAAKERGVDVSAEVTPHHLLLSEEDVRALDTATKVNPPLGTDEDRATLLEALRMGIIDCIATDHAPHAREEKEVPFEQAPMGTTGLETAFPALYTELVLGGALRLPLLLERMTAGAQLFGLQPPRIALGERASVTLVDLEARFVAGEHGWESRSENCCFTGRSLFGRVLLTLAGGAVAYRERAFSVVAV
jgi:dihydroorotase